MNDSIKQDLDNLIGDFAKHVASNPNIGAVYTDEDGRGVTESDIVAT